MTFFWILFGIDAATAMVVLWFFFIGLADGTVSSTNGGMWAALVGGVAAVLGGGWFLNAKGHRGAAKAVLAILAVPGFLFGLFVLAMIVFQPRWN